MSGFVWTVPPSAQLIPRTEALEQRILASLAAVGDLLAAKLQADAQANAPWTDRTGQARRGLRGLSIAARDLVIVYLFHEADYGKWLELAHGGRYQIIMPTLQANYGEAMRLIASIVGGAR